MSKNEGKGPKLVLLDDDVRLQGKFQRMLAEHGNKIFSLSMPLKNWCTIHGLVTLALDHPGIQDLSERTPAVADLYGDAHASMLQLCGLTPEEVDRLFRMREDDQK